MYTYIVTVALIVAIFSMDHLGVANPNPIDLGECAAVTCLAVTDCSNPITDISTFQNQCCPFCPGCRDQAEALSKKDPCNPCTCKTGRLTCELIGCPAIYCENAITPPGQCCQICP